MPLLKNSTLGARLGMSFALLVFLTLVVAISSGLAMRGIGASVSLITEDRMIKIDQLSDMKDNVNITARAVRNMVLAEDKAEMQAQAQRIADARTKNIAMLGKLADSITSAEGRPLVSWAANPKRLCAWPMRFPVATSTRSCR